MSPNSDFVNWFADHDYLGTGTTDVTEIGSATDDVVQTSSSAVAFTGEHKIVYGAPPSYGHVLNVSTDDGSAAFDLPVDYFDVPSNTWQHWSNGPHGQMWIALALRRTDW
jgi:hypothetical protein